MVWYGQGSVWDAVSERDALWYRIDIDIENGHDAARG